MAHDSIGEGTGAARASAAACVIEGWGRFVFAWDERGIMLIGLPDRAPGEHLGRLAGRGINPESTSEVPEKFRRALERYCAGEPDDLVALPDAQPGTEFQRGVWRALRDVPLGETRTYGAIAQACGRAKAIVAVSNACNANLVAIVVPDHRVVGRAAVGGYAAGTGWKQRLLEHEMRIRARRG